MPHNTPIHAAARIAELRIRQAIEDGKFDHLPGQHEPIPDIDQPYDPLWWIRAKLKREKLSAAPRTFTIRRDIEAKIEQLQHAPDESALITAVHHINHQIAAANASHIAGPTGGIPPLNQHAIIQHWRRRRPKPPTD